MKTLTWLTAICAVLVATSVYPQERVGDMYVGASSGMAFYPDLEEQTRKFENELRQEGYTGIDNLSFSTDDRVFAWSAYAGYHLNDDFAIEVGYLGSSEVNQRLELAGTFDGLEVSFDFKVKVRRWSLYAALVRQFSMDSSFVPFVKIGMRRWDDKFKNTGKITIANRTASVPLDFEGDNGLGLLLGGGLDVPVTDTASLRIEYLYLPLSEDHGGNEHRAHLGAYFAF